MNNLIPLECVYFREAVAVPGVTPKGATVPQRPSKETVVTSYTQPQGLMAKQRYELAFDRILGVVIITHPKSRETEEVPFANVLQWRRSAVSPLTETVSVPVAAPQRTRPAPAAAAEKAAT